MFNFKGCDSFFIPWKVGVVKVNWYWSGFIKLRRGLNRVVLSLVKVLLS